MELGLKGKRAIVTGGSRGIGKAIAAQLAASGVDVAICARTAETVAETVAELSATGSKVIGGAVDVADPVSFPAWIEAAVAELGGVDIFVANVSVGNGPNLWQQTFEADVMSTVRACETVIPHMKTAGGGAIVMISTTAAFEVWNGANAYGAFKAAMMNYAKNLAEINAPAQIRINTVSPGPVYFEGGAWTRVEAANPAFFDKILQSIPMGRMGSPADIAQAVTFLSSDAARYITGINLTVDGGRTRAVDY